jgi:hypothetical protein
MKIPRLDEVASAPDVFELVSDSSFYDVQRLWTKAKARAANDPDGAITAARAMLESLCKILINEAGESFTNRDDLPTLYGKAVFKLAPGQQTEAEYKKLAGSCAGTMDAIKNIRNREGDSHGGPQAAELLQAKFVVNITGSLVEFLIGIRNKRKVSEDGADHEQSSLRLVKIEAS